MRIARFRSALGAALLMGAFAASTARAQSTSAPTPAAPAGPVLGQFSAMRVAILPVQFWRADSAGWSAGVTWSQFRQQVDSAIAEGMRERGMGSRWAYGPDVVRSARRNPTLNSDPYALGVGRWRTAPPQIGEDLMPLVADNLRIVTALGDTRYALIPVDLRIVGDAAILRLVLADTRVRQVVWVGDVSVGASRGFLSALGARIADLVVEP
jgi:hypothetical protein